MYLEVRFAVVTLALAAAAVAVFFAYKALAMNAVALRSWTKLRARVSSMADSKRVEVELPGEPEPTTLVLTPVHSLGLSVDKTVLVYLDPADPKHAQFGGLRQMWLWPAALAASAAVLLLVAVVFARAGSGEPGDGWRLTTPPPAFETDIRLRPPASEGKVPIFWSLLGLAALAASILARSAPLGQRTVLAAIGALVMLGMLGIALESRTTEIRADSQRIRKSSAFGWIEVPWQKVARVELSEVIPDERTPGFFLNKSLPFPGRKVESYVFLDRRGRTILTMRPTMKPDAPMSRLLDLCREKTGVDVERKTFRSPVF